MNRHARPSGLLQGQAPLIVADRRADVVAGPLTLGHRQAGREQDGAARDPHADIVRRERHGSIHFGEALTEERDCLIAPAGRQGAPAAEEGCGAVPYQRLRMVGIFGKRALAQRERPLERFFIALEPGEHVAAHQVVEPLVRLGGGSRKDDEAEAGREHSGQETSHRALPFMAAEDGSRRSRCST